MIKSQESLPREIHAKAYYLFQKIHNKYIPKQILKMFNPQGHRNADNNPHPRKLYFFGSVRQFLYDLTQVLRAFSGIFNDEIFSRPNSPMFPVFIKALERQYKKPIYRKYQVEFDSFSSMKFSDVAAMNFQMQQHFLVYNVGSKSSFKNLTLICIY